jgi:hypothetical protein
MFSNVWRTCPDDSAREIAAAGKSATVTADQPSFAIAVLGLPTVATTRAFIDDAADDE